MTLLRSARLLSPWMSGTWIASPVWPRERATVVACVIVLRAGRTAPFLRYQETPLSASMTPTDCESGGLATLKPCRMVNREGSTSTGLPSASAASTRKRLSAPSFTLMSAAKAPFLCLTGPESYPPSSRVTRSEATLPASAGERRPARSGAGSVVMGSYSSATSTAPREAPPARSSAGSFCVEAKSAAPVATMDMGFEGVARLDAQLALEDLGHAGRERGAADHHEPVQLLRAEAVPP